MPSAPLVLASASLRRSELLTQLGVAFIVEAQNIDESVRPAESPKTYVERLAREKAMQAIAHSPVGAVILAADTTVVAGTQILGKPENQAEGLAMIKQLSACEHSVLTGVAVGDRTRVLSQVVETKVKFRAISHEEALRYWHTQEPLGKAGGYGIQGFAAAFVESISGSHSNVVGLPLFEVAGLLKEFGIPIWETAGESA
jgi:septum formation protein